MSKVRFSNSESHKASFRCEGILEPAGPPRPQLNGKHTAKAHKKGRLGVKGVKLNNNNHIIIITTAIIINILIITTTVTIIVIIVILFLFFY